MQTGATWITTLCPLLLLSASPVDAVTLRLEVEGIVHTISDDSLDPTVSIGDVMTGWVAIDTDDAPPDSHPFDPDRGKYDDTAGDPAGPNFLEGVFTLRG